jgi:large repetitive protein
MRIASLVLSDADGDPLSVTNLTAPAHGTAVLNADGTVTYTANAGFFGSDTFTYTAYDGIDAGNVAAVTIDVSKKPAKPPKPAKPTNLKP